MAGPSFDEDGDAVMFDDNNNDFQLPDNFDSMVNVATDRVLSLKHVYYPNKNGKRRKISKNSTINTVSPSSKWTGALEFKTSYCLWETPRGLMV